MDTDELPFRPKDAALMLLASGDLLPRKRARDQQADLIGCDVKRRVLQRMVELDPDPAQLAAALQQIVGELGDPQGPARAIAVSVREEVESAARHPDLLQWLISQATSSDRERAASPKSERSLDP